MQTKDEIISKLIDEKSELDSKLERLAKFIDNGTPGVDDPHQIALLVSQRYTMLTYSYLLDERMKALSA